VDLEESAMSTVQQLNRELADKVAVEARRNPQAYPGKFVGIANGQVVVISDDLEELERRLDEAEPDASRTFIVEPGLDINKVHEIWRFQ
jgi:hypothetical protein